MKLTLLMLLFTVPAFALDNLPTSKKKTGHVELTNIQFVGYDPISMQVDPKRYAKFVDGLHDATVAVVSVNGMVCDFCARGIAKTFKKDKSVQKIDVDLNMGKVLIAYAGSNAIDFEDIKNKILANGQNAVDYKVLEF